MISTIIPLVRMFGKFLFALIIEREIPNQSKLLHVFIEMSYQLRKEEVVKLLTTTYQ